MTTAMLETTESSLKRNERPKASMQRQFLQPQQAWAFLVPEKHFKESVQFIKHRFNEAAGMYDNASRIVTNTEQKQLLSTMARLKMGALKGLRAYENGKAQPPAQSQPRGSASVTQYLLDVSLKPISTLEEAFLFSFKKEHKELDIYTRLAEQETDFSTKYLFLHQTTILSEHIRQLESTFSHLVSGRSSPASPAQDEIL
jgi:hypothetical protein